MLELLKSVLKGAELNWSVYDLMYRNVDKDVLVTYREGCLTIIKNNISTGYDVEMGDVEWSTEEVLKQLLCYLS